MAINNGRYVVTGGYMDSNGNIVEERQWVPNTSTSPSSSGKVSTNEILQGVNDVIADNQNYFSPEEIYRIQSDGYYNAGNTALGDAYKALWQGSSAYSNTANQITDFYNQLANDVSSRESALAGAKYKLANQLTNDMANQRQYVLDTFGPNGTLTQEINKYYGDLDNYLSSEAGRAEALIDAQGVHSGASLGAIRAQKNEAYNEAFQRYLQAKEQELNAKQTIASNLINYMSTLRQEYGDTTNAYIIAQYERANDLLNNISNSISQDNIALSKAKLQGSFGGGSSSSSSSNTSLDDWIKYLALSKLSDDNNNNQDNVPSNNNLNSIILSLMDAERNNG